MTDDDFSRIFDLSGKTALVTGASGGLGQAIAVAFATHGADLVLVDRTEDELVAVARRCLTFGSQVAALTVDLSDERAVRGLVDQCRRIDVLVCNAGVQGRSGPVLEVQPSEWDAVFRINVASAHALAAGFVPQMAERGSGSVILMASIAGLRGNKSIGLYGMSKAALAQLARNLAVEWGPRGVRANAIAPGLIRTPFATPLLGDESFMARRLAATPLRRIGEPHEVAGVAVMLASDAGAFITGQTLVVDGGTLVSDGS